MHRIFISETTIIAAPSASGIVKYNNELLVISDNSPFLFRLNLKGKLLSKHLISNIPANEFGIIEKKFKPDFESMELVNENKLYIFGSGSKSPERDVLLIVYLDENYRTDEVNLTQFYGELKSLKALENVELNIEAITLLNDCIYFFNRSNNLMFWYPMKDFQAIIFENVAFVEPKMKQLSLPKIGGIEAGFSGATSWKNENAILFTASVENTPNAYDDGEILGSFIGIIEFNEANEVEIYSADPILENNNYRKIKVESICINSVSNSEIDLFLVTDNDGGASVLISCSFILD